MVRLRTLIVASSLMLSCNDTGPAEVPPCVSASCQPESLPLTGDADAPTVTDVTLECQSHAVVFLATATDPQGTQNLLGVMQTVGVFTNDACQGAPIVLRDDLAGSDLEESFGDAVVAATSPGLYDAICGCNEWAVTVEFSDLDGNTTSGRLAARVTHSP